MLYTGERADRRFCRMALDSYGGVRGCASPATDHIDSLTYCHRHADMVRSALLGPLGNLSLKDEQVRHAQEARDRLADFADRLRAQDPGLDERIGDVITRSVAKQNRGDA